MSLLLFLYSFCEYSLPVVVVDFCFFLARRHYARVVPQLAATCTQIRIVSEPSAPAAAAATTAAVKEGEDAPSSATDSGGGSDGAGGGGGGEGGGGDRAEGKEEEKSGEREGEEVVVLAEGRYSSGVLVALDPSRPTALKLMIGRGGGSAGGGGGGGTSKGVELLLGAVNG